MAVSPVHIGVVNLCVRVGGAVRSCYITLTDLVFIM